MATEPQVKELLDRIDKALRFDKDSLISRPKWGEITFDAAKRDYDRIYDILNHLKVLPLQYLTDNAASSMISPLDAVTNVFDKIDKFSVQQGSPEPVKNQLVAEVHQQADSIYSTAAMWIPFLAYQKGDVSKNIESLTKAVEEGRKICDVARGDIEERAREIQNIIEKAREASAAAGAAVFTKDFRVEAGDLKDRAYKWLWATAIMATITIGIAAIMWSWTNDILNQWQLVQKMGTKFIILGVLFSGTFWCGRIYKALMHQSSVYNHRALSIQTLQAFSAGASDIQTKDVVLTEAARAVFGNVPTGYIDEKHAGYESGIKIVEVAKNLIPRGGAG